MPVRNSNCKLFVALVLISHSAACSHTYKIHDAQVIKIDESSSSIKVSAPHDSLIFVKRNEIYVYMVIVECDDSSRRFPMEAYTNNQRLSDFNFEVNSDKSSTKNDIFVTSTIKNIVLKQYKNPCVLLEGGSYKGLKLESNLTNLVRK